MGVNYMLEKFKDKKESALREEIKDRVFTQMNESTNRVRELEQNVVKLVSVLRKLF